MIPAAAESDLRRYNAASAHLEPPFAIIDLTAMRANAAAMTLRAGRKPIRLASKSVRCRAIIDKVLRMRALTSDDILVGYPTADHASLTRLTSHGCSIATAASPAVRRRCSRSR